MSQTKKYVTIDKDGAMYVGEARVPMEAIVITFEAGESAESIGRHYRGLRLEEIYGAIAYYLANKDLVLEYMKRQDALWEEWERKLTANPSPLIQRLRALRDSKAKNEAEIPRRS
jgi:uncharacterized protein (DUF433 family)